MPATPTNNRICDAPISISDVGVAPCACSFIELKIDLSRHMEQTLERYLLIAGKRRRK